MPRYSGKKPFHHELFNRHVGEMRNLLHVLEMREGLDEGENRPRVDMYESAEEIVLEFDLPGFAPSDIKLRISGVTLVLDACKQREQVDGAYICMERNFGHFGCAIQIPGTIDASRMTAEYRLGVLKVKCPKCGDRLVPIKEIKG